MQRPAPKSRYDLLLEVRVLPGETPPVQLMVDTSALSAVQVATLEEVVAEIEAELRAALPVAGARPILTLSSRLARSPSAPPAP